jgi:hypothetical protein
MNSRELINRILELDPEGELEVTCEKADIIFVDTMPCYYDGRVHKFIKDPNLPKDYKYFPYIKAKIMSEGIHIDLQTWTIEEALYDNPDFEVDLSEAIGGDKKAVKAWRKKGIELQEEIRRLNNGT